MQLMPDVRIRRLEYDVSTLPGAFQQAGMTVVPRMTSRSSSQFFDITCSVMCLEKKSTTRNLSIIIPSVRVIICASKMLASLALGPAKFDRAYGASGRVRLLGEFFPCC